MQAQERPTKRVERAILSGFGALVLGGSVAFGTLVLAMFLSELLDTSVLGTWGVTVSGVVLLSFLVRKRGFWLSRVLSGAFSASLVVGYFMAAGFAHDEQIVALPAVCGTGMAGLYLIAPVVIMAAGGIGGVIAEVCAVRFRFVNLVASVGMLALAMLLLMGAVARLPLPYASEFLDSIEPVATLPTPADGTEAAPIVDRAFAEDSIVSRRCTGPHACMITVTSRLGETGEPPLEHWVPNQALPIRILEGNIIVVGTSVAFVDGEPTSLSVRSVASSVRAHHGWTASGLGLSLLGLGTLLVFLFQSLRARLRGRPRVGNVKGGTLRFSDHRYPSMARADTPDGPAVVFENPATGGPSYREHEVPRVQAIPGTPVEVASRGREMRSAVIAAALTFTAAGLTPLLSAYTAGLIF